MTIIVVHFVMKRPPRTQRTVAHGVEHALVPLVLKALENPTPPMGEAEDVGVVEMATLRAEPPTAIIQ